MEKAAILAIGGLLDNSTTLKYGSCSISVRICDDFMQEHITEAVQKLNVQIDSNSRHPDCSLTIIAPYPSAIPNPKYRAIAQSWARARRAIKKNRSNGLEAWRALYQFGIPIEQNIFLFQDKDGNRNDYFCLNPTDTVRHPYRPSLWIIRAIEALGVHWQVTHGGALLHASGVDRNGVGYLFLGQSGAGKSTVACLSEQKQGIIIHDDQIMLSLDSGHYLLTHPGNRIMPLLRAVFLLKQSNMDRLVPLTPQATSAGLGKSLLEYAIGQNLYGPWLRQAFHNVAAVAHTVSGYELHFRKSPDFWKLIDERFPD